VGRRATRESHDVIVVGGGRRGWAPRWCWPAHAGPSSSSMTDATGTIAPVRSTVISRGSAIGFPPSPASIRSTAWASTTVPAPHEWFRPTT